MQTWPSHHRPPNPSAKSSRKNQKFVGRNYPVLDHGIVEAATLVQKDGRFEWDSLVCGKPNGKHSCVAYYTVLKFFEARRYRLHGNSSIFPVTRSPPIPEPTATVDQRADHGAHFLRTHFPDVDVSGDMIRNQITEDTLQTTELAKFDPFEDNVLDIISGYDDTKHLAFPTGELSAELNLTPIVQANGTALIKPSTTPARTFSTPVQQITSSATRAPNDSSQRNTFLGVRTFGATSLLKLDPEATAVGGVQDVTYFTSHDVGGVSIVDVKVFPSVMPFETLLANKKEPSPTSPFCRIGQGTRPTECTILSGKTLHQLDFRSNEVSPLFTESSKGFLTSSEGYARDGLIRLCSTSEIIWLDPRYPGKPLLGYKHYRQFDRTLNISTFFIDGSPTTLLSSKRNGMLTIYNVSRHDDEFIRANDMPYGVLPSDSYRQFTGHAFLQHGSGSIAVFRADERAGVDCVLLQQTVDENVQELQSLLVLEESDTLKELRRKAENMKTDMDIFGDQEKALTNLYPAYDHVFRIHMEQQEKLEEEQAEDFYDTMDRLPAFWQTSDTPSEHMLTSCDIAFRTHEDSSNSSRSDFTTGSLINSARGFRAISQNKFPIQQLRKGAPWHLNIADIQNHINPTFNLNADARELAEDLRSYDLIMDDNRTALSIRRENNAREQLTVDLALSKDVYSLSPFVAPREAGNDLETMTEALSLGGRDIEEPPEVEFSYLRPRIKLPLGVRLLLKDWEVGTKAKDYVFQDPYNTTGESVPRYTVHPGLSRLRQANTMPSMSQVMNSQRPPMVIPSQALTSSLGSASQPSAKQPPPVVVQSEAPTIRPTGTFGTQPLQQFGMGISQSQASQDDSSQQTVEYMASTQTLPGPHGGRPSMPKKKPAKKRLGGF
ncbi:hypothetical protein AN958_09508 [Leucoagaricus sp. SymC.cos]|nr:hypothetical protein AN958_09508 [Leucoagaricus sp. SymC.cos]